LATPTIPNPKRAPGSKNQLRINRSKISLCYRAFWSGRTGRAEPHNTCELTVPQVEHLLESILKTHERLKELGFTYYNGKIVVIETEEVVNE
jgi:hypothetical protein